MTQTPQCGLQCIVPRTNFKDDAVTCFI
uniref:Uncharacterized protein n=1 Tax=Anguilla anguilla TaxID=7936 RepID=A0A0E9VTL6_ANGAN